jgi:hypothetical protein
VVEWTLGRKSDGVRFVRPGRREVKMRALEFLLSLLVFFAGPATVFVLVDAF